MWMFIKLLFFKVSENKKKRGMQWTVFISINKKKMHGDKKKRILEIMKFLKICIVLHARYKLT